MGVSVNVLQLIVREFVKNVLQPLVRKFVKKIEKKYIEIYPLDRVLCDVIETETANPSSRISAINKIRTNNIVTTIWAKTGTILGIIITLISFLLTMMLAFYIPFTFSGKFWFQISFFLTFFLLIGLIYYVLINAIPYLIKRIVFHLPSKEYADISLNSLDNSEILTFLALRMWELCRGFKVDIVLSTHLQSIINLNVGTKKIRYFQSNKVAISNEIDELYISVKKYSADYTKELNNCVALMKLASDKLNIQERELLNHILKFSPYIFNKRIESLRSATSTLNFILKSSKDSNPDFQTVFFNNLHEIGRICAGIERYSMRSLKQVILYDDIHTYLIGMSSIVSTSRSLKMFCEGLGSSLSDRKNGIKPKNPKLKKDLDVCIEKFKSIIHRSKAHYGMDLLILLENFCTKRSSANLDLSQLPEAIFNIKYPKRKEKKGISGYFENMEEIDIINKIEDNIFHLRNYMILQYPAAIKSIKDEFKFKLDSLNANEGRVYFCLFGYSRIVRNVLKSFASEIYEKDITAFVIKEDTPEMIDTQIYRFELNDDKPNYNLRRTFTASDEFFKKLINAKDTVVFIGGAEAYDTNCHKLFHTNNYQNRIQDLIRYTHEEIKVKTEIWILAGDYKLFDEFPDKESLFGYEFFSDHYDKIDLYDFYKHRDIVSLIHNKNHDDK